MFLQHTIIDIKGKDLVTGVTIVKTDLNKNLIKGTNRDLECDTILLSCGLIPENELASKTGIILDNKTGGPVINETMETCIEGVFACGNVVHVHDLADWATKEGYKAGEEAAAYIQRSNFKAKGFIFI